MFFSYKDFNTQKSLLYSKFFQKPTTIDKIKGFKKSIFDN